MPKAKAAALKALELDETLAEAHASLGFISSWYDWDWPAAEREFKRAIDLNPGYVTTYQWYAAYFGNMGRVGEGMTMARKGLDLDPLAMNLHFAIAGLYCQARQKGEAIKQCRKMLDLDPGFIWTSTPLESAYYYEGMYEESLAASKRFWALMGNGEVVEALERGYEASGFKGAMVEGAQKLVEQSETRYIPAMTFVQLYVRAEEKDKAMEWLEKAYDERDVWLSGGLRTWEWNFRSDPRFQDLLRRMNFPE